MKRTLVVILLTAVLGNTALAARNISAAEIQNTLSRAVAQEMLKNSSAAYEVQVTVLLEKEVRLKDAMLRSPRYPANGSQILAVSKAEKQCAGVLVSQGTQVIFPAVCLAQRGYLPVRISLQFNDGTKISARAETIVLQEDIAWVNVDADATKQNSYVSFVRTPPGRTLQEQFGSAMTEQLKAFFHARHVREKRRCRVGAVCREPRLRVGEPVFYRGKVVALVQERVHTYGKLCGGVSERALAIIR